MIANFATAIGIVGGGLFADFRLFKHRELRPRAEVEHPVVSRRRPGDECWVRLTMTIANRGNTWIRFDYRNAWLERISSIASVPPRAHRGTRS